MLIVVPKTSAATSTLLHLRLPFFFFLAPIWLFALASAALAAPVEPFKAAAVFVIFHFLLYPASNGFNSYYDRDRGPIGGLASPPELSPSLMPVALGLDALALIAGFILDPLLGLAALLYGIGSKLYSWDRTRLKARPIGGWLATGFGQGALTYLSMVATMSPAGFGILAKEPGTILWGALLQTLFLLGVYPLTQVYQHEEDERRGDLTISRLLGVRGTFVLAACFLAAAMVGIAAWLATRFSLQWAILFLLVQAPTPVIFAAWARRSFRDAAAADFRSCMVMNFSASGLMNLFLILLVAVGKGG
jgi:1,4-dihydroxy-2-naphthoate octaprenyltransferase